MRFLVGLIGSGIGASGSPALHENEAAALGHALHYHLIDLDSLGRTPADLPRLLDAAQTLGFAGLNITHPCKQAVIPFLDRLSPEAAAIGAVNTVVFSNGGRTGYNTDCVGFRRNLQRGLPGASLDCVVLLGAGGGGSAVASAALQAGARELRIVDIDAKRASQLVNTLRAGFSSSLIAAFPDAAQACQGATGLIHATPTGMAAHPGLPLPAELLQPGLWIADIVYFPLETELLREARRRGCLTLDGGGMAVYQAAEAFRLFTGLQPDADRMMSRFRSRAAV